MGTLKEDIKIQSEWIVKAFAEDGFILDNTINSILEIDRFFMANMDGNTPKKGGRLVQNVGSTLFSIGSYVGETVIKNISGSEWNTNDSDPDGELTVSLKLPDGSIIFPVQKIMKRFKNGSEDAIYPYIHMVTKEFTQEPFNENFWNLTAESMKSKSKRPWWKFW